MLRDEAARKKNLKVKFNAMRNKRKQKKNSQIHLNRDLDFCFHYRRIVMLGKLKNNTRFGDSAI